MIDHVLLGLVVVAASAVLIQQRPVDAYKILMIPIPGMSHLFSMVAMAKGLTGRGHHHRVSLLVGEHYPITDDLKNVFNSSTISLIRYSDTDDSGVTTDYQAMEENLTTLSMDWHLERSSVIPAVRE